MLSPPPKKPQIIIFLKRESDLVLRSPKCRGALVSDCPTQSFHVSSTTYPLSVDSPLWSKMLIVAYVISVSRMFSIFCYVAASETLADQNGFISDDKSDKSCPKPELLPRLSGLTASFPSCLLSNVTSLFNLPATFLSQHASFCRIRNNHSTFSRVSIQPCEAFSKFSTIW